MFDTLISEAISYAKIFDNEVGNNINALSVAFLLNQF